MNLPTAPEYQNMAARRSSRLADAVYQNVPNIQSVPEGVDHIRCITNTSYAKSISNDRD